MANGYLGKISAIVTANTSDFSGKLNASAQDIRKFSAELKRSIDSASSQASASLRGIYTETQRLDRALQAASTRKLAFKGFEGDTLERDVQRVKELASATRSITKPLADSAKSFGQLSAGVQAGFLPALISAQKGTEALTTTINKFGDVSEQRFAAVEARVSRTVQAIARLREAEQSVGGLATGRELRFQQPAFVQQVNRSAQLQGAAAALTPEQIQGGAVAQLIAQQRQAAEEASRLLAALEQVRLSRNGDTAAAEAAYRSQVDSLRTVNNQLEREITLAGEAAAATRLRAQAASQLLNVLQQESQLISNQGRASTTDPTGRSIAQRIQDIANLRRVEEERANAALRQAEADEVAASAARLRAQAAGQLLNVLQQESTLISNEGARSTTDPTGRPIAQRLQDINNLRAAEAAQVAAEADQQRRRDVGSTMLPVLQRESDDLSRRGGIGASEVGAGIPDAVRQMDRLASSTVSVRGQIDTLPAGVRAQLIPAIEAAEQRFIQLRTNGVGATAEQIENAAAEVRRLGAAASNAARFSQTLGESFDQSRVDEFSARLTALRGILQNVGAVAGTQAAAAFERLRIEIQEAAVSGDFTARIGEIRRLEQEAIAAASAFGGLSTGRITDQLNRAGDIGRQGFDRYSLAIQQAAFAIDDFFSVTGGLDQRIRAIGNNVTQLAFLVGGTTGLFIGIGAVLGLQVLVPLVRFIFDTERAAEALNVLNAALEANQRNAESLAESYRRLADEIAQVALTEQDQKQRTREQRVEEITRQRDQVEREAFAAGSPEVVRIRAERAVLERQRNESDDIEERLRIQRQIDDNRRREEAALAARGSAEGESLIVDAADRAVAAQETRLNRARLREDLGFPAVPGEEVDSVRRDLEAARERQRLAASRILPGAATPIGTRFQLDALSESLSQAEQARQELLNSFPRGVPAEGDAARPTRLAELDETINALRDRVEILKEVLGSQLATELIDGGFQISDTLASVSESIGGEISDIESRRASLGRELSDIAKELETLKDPARAEELKAQQEAIKAQSEELLASARAARTFADVLNKAAGDLARTVEGELFSAEESARRAANATEAQFGPDSPRTAVARNTQERLESARRDAARRRADIEAQIASERISFEQDILAGRADPEVAARASRIRELEAIRDDDKKSASDREAARREIEGLQREQEDAFNNRPRVRALREAADRGDIQAQRELQQIQAAERGRALAQTPAQRAAEDVATGLEDLRQFFGQQAEATTGLIDQKGLNEAASRFVNEQARAAAPAIFSLADSVANAVLQGPSRAALNATDVSTVEGQRELNRLLRGDDSARDANIVELEKQSQSLGKLVQLAEEDAKARGIVLDFK